MRSKGFIYNLAGFVFEYFCDSRRILATFTKFCLIRFSQHDCIVLHAIQRARTQAPLHLPHKFFDVKSLYKILPRVPIVIAKSRLNAAGISSRHALFVRRLGDLVSAKEMQTGGGFVKFCVKKACVGDGRERERALDDVFRI